VAFTQSQTGGTALKKYLALAVVIVCTFAGGCSYTERTTATGPAPAPAVVTPAPTSTTQKTVYRDSYTGKPLSSSTTVTTTR
jgi:hypothetical protein